MAKAAMGQKKVATQGKTATLTDGDLSHLAGTLTSQKQLGIDAYPPTVKWLLSLAGMPESTAAELASKAGRSPMARKLFAITAKSNADNSAAGAALIVLPEDLDVVAGSPGLLVTCLKNATKSNSQLLTVVELRSQLSSRFAERFNKVWKGNANARRLPAEVGILYRRGNACLFLLNQLSASGATARIQTAPVATELPSASRPKPANCTAAVLSTLSQRVLVAFDLLDRQTGSRNYVTLAALRAALSDLSRQDLDAAINDLRRAQRVTLDSADGRHERLGAEEIAAAIVEDGNRLVYMARRQG